jgi:hypothetical protein
LVTSDSYTLDEYLIDYTETKASSLVRSRQDYQDGFAYDYYSGLEYSIGFYRQPHQHLNTMVLPLLLIELLSILLLFIE